MLGVIGINHVSARLEAREIVSCRFIACLQHTPYLSSVPCIIVQTCNRTEWYFSSPYPMQIHTELLTQLRRQIGDGLIHTLYSYFDINCFIHLYRVVAGLDSAFFGETEIQGQIRKAYINTIQQHPRLCSDLHFLFQKALQAGKRIRKSLPYAALIPYQLQTKVLNRIKSIQQISSSSSILFLGASVINQRICTALLSDGTYTNITVANRTEKKATDFAKRFSIRAIPFAIALQKEWKTFDCIISAVQLSSYLPLFSTHHVTNLPSSPPPTPHLIIDLGVPRTINPCIATCVGQLDNIETLFPEAGLQSIFSSTQTSSILARQLATISYNNLMERKRKNIKQICLSLHEVVQEETITAM